MISLFLHYRLEKKQHYIQHMYAQSESYSYSFPLHYANKVTAHTHHCDTHSDKQSQPSQRSSPSASSCSMLCHCALCGRRTRSGACPPRPRNRAQSPHTTPRLQRAPPPSSRSASPSTWHSSEPAAGFGPRCGGGSWPIEAPPSATGPRRDCTLSSASSSRHTGQRSGRAWVPSATFFRQGRHVQCCSPCRTQRSPAAHSSRHSTHSHSRSSASVSASASASAGYARGVEAEANLFSRASRPRPTSSRVCSALEVAAWEEAGLDRPLRFASGQLLSAAIEPIAAWRERVPWR